MPEMNPEFDFVTSPIEPGLSVIEAGAGTGKTFAISHLVPRLLLEGTANHIGEILLVTYTNEATRELSERTRQVLEALHAPAPPDEAICAPGIARLRANFSPGAIRKIVGRALLDIDRLDVSTIHSFCQSVLRDEGALCGFPVLPDIIPEALEILADATADVWERDIAGCPIVSGIAASWGWSIGGDTDFFRMAIARPACEFNPAPRPFLESLEKIKFLPGKLHGALLNDFRSLIGQVTSPTKKMPPLQEIEDGLTFLETCESVGEPDFFRVLRGFSMAGEWVSGTKQKPLKGLVASSALVGIACELERDIQCLRWDFRCGVLPEIARRVAARLGEERLITYDGLIDAVVRALRGPSGSLLANRLAAHHKIGLIDESQDTDPRQFDIFKSVFLGVDGDGRGEHRMLLIGDPKQAIYGFRGADLATYLDARRLAGRRLFQLTKTYRAPAALVRASNAFFSRSNSFLNPDLHFTPATSGVPGDEVLLEGGQDSAGRIEAWVVPDADGENYSNDCKRTKAICGAVATRICSMLRDGAELCRRHEEGTLTSRRVQPGHIAILTNKNTEAAAMVEALLQLGIPAIRSGAEDVFSTEEAGELLLLLRAVHEPRRTGLRNAALATRLLGRTHSDLLRLREGGGEADAVLTRFLAWRDEWRSRGIAAAISRIERDEEVFSRLAGGERGERRITNLRQLSDVLQTASAGQSRRPGRLLRWFAREITAISSGDSPPDERLQQLESDAEAVRVLTMHSAKGLEFPLVFCPFLWAGASARSRHSIRWIRGGDGIERIVDLSLVQGKEGAEFTAQFERKEIEDRLRLAYVALTRARVKAWIFCGELCGTRNRSRASSLDWLLREHEDAEFLEWFEMANSAGRGTRHADGLQVLAEAGDAGEVIGIQPPPAANAATWQPAGGLAHKPPSALHTPEIPTPWGMTSFSALTREREPRGGHDAPSRSVTASPMPDGELASGGFRFAPGGSLMGTAIHDWLEQWDFTAPDSAEVALHLEKYPLPIPAGDAHLAGQVTEMLGELRGALLPGLGCTVAEACPSASASEWHFQLPLRGEFDAGALAAIFETHGQPEYAGLLAGLPIDELQGYLHGFIDRIALYDGKWGIIDWKTNRLGIGDDDYLEESLLACAKNSHYLLQTHLYLVALRRFLGPETPLAGAWLVFLRGIQAGGSRSILHVAPSMEMLDALDHLFETASR